MVLFWSICREGMNAPSDEGRYWIWFPEFEVIYEHRYDICPDWISPKYEYPIDFEKFSKKTSKISIMEPDFWDRFTGKLIHQKIMSTYSVFWKPESLARPFYWKTHKDQI